MSPKYNDGDVLDFCEVNNATKIEIGDLVVFTHPFKSKLKLFKRITKIKDGTKIFVEGDNPDPLSSEDSHNFGFIDIKAILGYLKE